MNDKEIELNRYNCRATQYMAKCNYFSTNKKLYLQPPYDTYKQLLNNIDNKSNILEIGAGMGENTGILLESGFNVCATDISPKSVEVLRKYFYSHDNLEVKVADMENLPFDDSSFDMVCSAGSLSYGDNIVVMNEIYRVLKVGGAMIAVDSLNNNFIYRINRYVHYLRGDRSKSTLRRIPTISLIEKYTDKFGYAEVKYFGAVTWLFPLLDKLFTEKTITKLSNWIDGKFQIRKSAFKFTMMLVKK